MTDKIIAKHWSEVDREGWDKISPFFTPKELACSGSGSLKINLVALKSLNELRKSFGGPLKINSAFRSVEHNKAVGGSPKSQHLDGVAFDIALKDKSVGRKLEALAREIGFTGIGRYETFIHVDMRPAKSDGSIYEWGVW